MQLIQTGAEVFDPEKVERLTIPRMPPIEFVRASDYDKLLAIYREATREHRWPT